jgi:hypothetical protein
MIKGIEIYKADRRPFVQMMVERYQSTRYDHKFFVFGFVCGICPYVFHMNQWLK